MNDYKEEMARGEAFVASGELKKARALFEQIVRAAPLNYEAINNLGTVAYLQGDALAAEVFLLKAFKLNKNNSDVLVNLVDLYVNSKDLERALYFLEKYLELAPLDHERLDQLASIHMETGSPDKAVPVLERSLEIQPDEGIRNTLESLKNAQNKIARPFKKSSALLSVGLPVFNGEKYIAQAIESILVQDFENFELIISDNCSTDRTRDICLYYQGRDSRIHYHRFDENMGMLTNFLAVLGLSESPFFMFASHDDLREKSFMSSCLCDLLCDPSIALVFTRSKVMDADSNYLGIANDGLSAFDENPAERFRHVIWELGMCNAMLGVFRTSMLKKITCWGATQFFDTLLLAEISLLGKIVQLEDPLFIRRLTRNYNYRSHDERNTQLIFEIDPKLLKEGITLPHCRLAYGHLDIINQSALDDPEKENLMKEVFHCFRKRYHAQMKYEIDRALYLIDHGCLYHQWNETEVTVRRGKPGAQGSFHLSSLLKRLQEALFFYPEREDLASAYKKCWDDLLAPAPEIVS
ncbi:MAG: glycosyltransferase [Syntrophaceae bacterium]